MLSFFPLDVLGEIWDVIESVSEGFLTYSFLFLALVVLFSTERNGLSNFGRGLTKEHSCEIISKSVLKSNLGGRSRKKHSCIIISKSIYWLRRRSRLKVFFYF